VINPDRVYWDSSTYIDLLTGEHALRDAMEMLIDDWKLGLVTLVTSTLTIAEVYFLRLGTPKRVDRTRDRDIDALFDPPPPRRLLTVELSRYTAMKARDIARGFSISGRDAIHVASALEAHCPVLQTTDDALWEKSGMVGGTPVLRIEPPKWSRQDVMQENIEPGRVMPLVDPSELRRHVERSDVDPQE
jgi:predicted nucleic acid-binding protein